MSNAMQSIISHFDGLIPTIIHVPEWDLDIHVAPRSLVMQAKLIRSEKKGDEVERALDILVLLARDEDGEPLFDLESKKVFRKKAEAFIVARVAGELMRADPISGAIDDGDEPETKSGV